MSASAPAGSFSAAPSNRLPALERPALNDPVAEEEVIYAPSDLEDAPLPAGRSVTPAHHVIRARAPEIIGLDVIPRSSVRNEVGLRRTMPASLAPPEQSPGTAEAPRMLSLPPEPDHPLIPPTPIQEPTPRTVDSPRSTPRSRGSTYVLRGRLVSSGRTGSQPLSGVRVAVYERGTDFLDAKQLVSGADLLDVFVTDANGFFVSGEISTADGFFMGTSDPALVVYRTASGSRSGPSRREPMILHHIDNITAGEHDLGAIPLPD